MIRMEKNIFFTKTTQTTVVKNLRYGDKKSDYNSSPRKN